MGEGVRMDCDHADSVVRAKRAYAIPVSHDENQAAHGCVTYEVECVECGARRSENINGRHAEFGPWGSMREERAAAVRAAWDQMRQGIAWSYGDQSLHVFMFDHRARKVAVVIDGQEAHYDADLALVSQLPQDADESIRDAWAQIDTRRARVVSMLARWSALVGQGDETEIAS